MLLHVKAAAFSLNPFFFFFLLYHSPDIVRIDGVIFFFHFFFFIIFPHGLARKIELYYTAKCSTGCESLLPLHCLSRAAEPVLRVGGGGGGGNSLDLSDFAHALFVLVLAGQRRCTFDSSTWD